MQGIAGAQCSPDAWAAYGDGGAMTTTGGEGGPVVTVDNASDFISAVGDRDPIIVLVQGTIDLGGSVANVRSNTSILGLGNDATIIGGLKISGYDNLIVRNLTIRDSNNDGLTIQNAKYVWVDHCTFIDSSDGQLDITHAADWITISWCHFYYTFDHGHNFVNLIGHSDGNAAEDTGTLHVTFHHNMWGEFCIERMPRVRFGRVHVYNNYFNVPGNNYCIRAALYSEIFSENNYFKDADEPFEYYAVDGNPIGKIKDVGSVLDNCTNVYDAMDAVFAPPYAYTPDPANEIPALVSAGAGAGVINPICDLTDTEAPTPNPAGWAVVPQATGPNSIAMTAATASDDSGVEYYFANVGLPAHDSGWQNSVSYTDTNLDPSTQYTYTVRYRDKSPGQNLGAASTEESATTSAPDLTPPTPNPMQWAVEPMAAGPRTITMTAATATDPGGVEYYFVNQTDPAHDSGWQASPNYTDDGLEPKTQYTYVVKARDMSTAQNETAVSPARSATTESIPPLPEPVFHWKFDESNGTTAHDSGPHGLDGVFGNTSGANWVPGQFGNAASFDGIDDQLVMPHDDALNLGAGAFTITFWLKQDAVGSDQEVYLVKGSYASPQSGKRFEFYRKDQTFRFTIDDNSVKTEVAVPVGNFVNGAWTLVAGVRDTDAGELRLYAYDLLVGTQPDATGNIDQAELLYIGDQPFVSAVALGAQMDDLRIYDAALTVEQIGLVMDGAQGTPPEAAVRPAHWALYED